MIEDPSFPWAEFLAYCVAAVAAYYAGRANARIERLRETARALWFVCHQAQERGVFFSKFDRTIIEESRKRLQ